MKQTAKDKLIIALDVDHAGLALELFEELRDCAGMFKIGLQLFSSAGPDIVRQIISRGGRVFLDLKFHDIPNTVAGASVEATRLGVSIFNVHASGGSEMMRRSLAAVDEVVTREGLVRPKVIAVTVLTSLDARQLNEIGFQGEPSSLVTHLTKQVAACGLDGVVASPQEIAPIREHVAAPGFLIVTPGIRSGQTPADDQRRVLSAAAALRAGADYLVVGRPVLEASDRALAARQLLSEIEQALSNLKAAQA